MLFLVVYSPPWLIEMGSFAYIRRVLVEKLADFCVMPFFVVCLSNGDDLSLSIYIYIGAFKILVLVLQERFLCRLGGSLPVIFEIFNHLYRKKSRSNGTTFTLFLSIDLQFMML